MAKKFNYKDKTWETPSKKEFQPVITPLIVSQYQQPFDNELSQAETERLAILAEEAAEVIHVVGKILRHGYSSEWQKVGKPNRKQLEREVGDLLNIISVMWYNNDISERESIANMQDKANRWMEYTHHQGL